MKQWSWYYFIGFLCPIPSMEQIVPVSVTAIQSFLCILFTAEVYILLGINSQKPTLKTETFISNSFGWFDDRIFFSLGTFEFFQD